jgi:hypothetical protein
MGRGGLPPVIGVAGYVGVGKDEVCRVLERHGYTITRFSSALKAEVRAKLRRTMMAIGDAEAPHGVQARGDEAVLDWLEQRKPPILRALYQEFGTEVRRGDDPDYWVKRWQGSVVDGIYITGLRYCVADVRFPNEASAVRELGGVIWRVVRPGVGPQSDHASEAQGFDVDVTIANDGTLDDLAERVAQALGVTRRKSG